MIHFTLLYHKNYWLLLSRNLCQVIWDHLMKLQLNGKIMQVCRVTSNREQNFTLGSQEICFTFATSIDWQSIAATATCSYRVHSAIFGLQRIKFIRGFIQSHDATMKFMNQSINQHTHTHTHHVPKPKSQILPEPILQFATFIYPRLPKSIQKLRFTVPKYCPIATNWNPK